MSNEKTTAKNSQSGFTLMELMIVLAIVSVLAAALVPNFQRQVQAAHVAAAITDMRCVQTALTNYALKNPESPIPQTLDTYSGLASTSSSNGCAIADDPENRRVIESWCTIVIGGIITTIPCNLLDPQPQGYEIFVRLQKVAPDYPGAVVRLSSDRGIRAFTLAQAQQIISNPQL